MVAITKSQHCEAQHRNNDKIVSVKLNLYNVVPKCKINLYPLWVYIIPYCISNSNVKNFIKNIFMNLGKTNTSGQKLSCHTSRFTAN